MARLLFAPRIIVACKRSHRVRSFIASVGSRRHQGRSRNSSIWLYRFRRLRGSSSSRRRPERSDIGNEHVGGVGMRHLHVYRGNDCGIDARDCALWGLPIRRPFSNGAHMPATPLLSIGPRTGCNSEAPHPTRAARGEIHCHRQSAGRMPSHAGLPKKGGRPPKAVLRGITRSGRAAK